MSQSLFTKKCAYCGKTFSTAHYPTQCCSQSCYFKLKLRRENLLKLRKLKVLKPNLKAYIKKDKIYYVKTCPICGRVFDTCNSLQIYCSDSCKGRSRILRKNFDSLSSSSSSLPTEVTDSSPVRKYLRISEVSKYLSVSTRTLHKWAEKGYLTKYRLGGLAYFKQEDVDRLFSVSNEISTVDLLRFNKRYLSVAEVAKKYGMLNSEAHHILKENKMHYIVYRNMPLYEKDEVETLFSFLLPDKENAKKQNYHWVTADELAAKYGRSRNSIYYFCSSHHIPTLRSGRSVLYASERFENAYKRYTQQHK